MIALSFLAVRTSSGGGRTTRKRAGSYRAFPCAIHRLTRAGVTRTCGSCKKPLGSDVEVFLYLVIAPMMGCTRHEGRSRCEHYSQVTSLNRQSPSRRET